jgi:hypothetical protein
MKKTNKIYFFVIMIIISKIFIIFVKVLFLDYKKNDIVVIIIKLIFTKA